MSDPGKGRWRRLGWALALVLAFGAGVVVGQGSAVDAEPRPDPYGRLNTFAKVMSYIERSYVDPVEEGKLIDASIKGMVASLDPHSVYLTPQEYKALREETDGEFVGVGLEVGREHGQVRVISPIEGSPSARAGIEAGDVVLSIDGTTVRDMSLRDVVVRLKGRKHTKVTVELARPVERNLEAAVDLGLARTYSVTMERETIDVVAVTWRLLEPGYGYIRIRSFQEHVALDMEEALTALEKASAKPLKGLVLDLRNNPGGLLVEAVRVVDLFIDEGLIVSTRGRDDRNVDAYEARASSTRVKVPVVVLVNRGSASASEIVAGALRDHERATILGVRTYGKGSVQSIIDIQDGSGLKLTVGRYYTPSGASIQDKGVIPHVEVHQRRPDASASGGAQGKEGDHQLDEALAYLRGHKPR